MSQKYASPDTYDIIVWVTCWRVSHVWITCQAQLSHLVPPESYTISRAWLWSRAFALPCTALYCYAQPCVVKPTLLTNICVGTNNESGYMPNFGCISIWATEIEMGPNRRSLWVSIDFGRLSPKLEPTKQSEHREGRSLNWSEQKCRETN